MERVGEKPAMAERTVSSCIFTVDSADSALGWMVLAVSKISDAVSSDFAINTSDPSSVTCNSLSIGKCIFSFNKMRPMADRFFCLVRLYVSAASFAAISATSVSAFMPNSSMRRTCFRLLRLSTTCSSASSTIRS